MLFSHGAYSSQDISHFKSYTNSYIEDKALNTRIFQANIHQSVCSTGAHMVGIIPCSSFTKQGKYLSQKKKGIKKKEKGHELLRLTTGKHRANRLIISSSESFQL